MCGTITQPHKALWNQVEQAVHIDFYHNINKDAFHVPSQAYGGRSSVVVIAQSKMAEHPGILCAETHWGVQLRDQWIYNARIETVAQRPAWADAFHYYRYLVPVVSFFELDHTTHRAFECYKDNDSVFMLGAIGVRAEGSQLRHAVICTRPAQKAIEGHHKRQPVIIPSYMYEAWLTNNHNPASMIGELTNEREPIQLRQAA